MLDSRRRKQWSLCRHRNCLGRCQLASESQIQWVTVLILALFGYHDRASLENRGPSSPR